MLRARTSAALEPVNLPLPSNARSTFGLAKGGGRAGIYVLDKTLCANRTDDSAAPRPPL
jgi:hypothetical protein